MQVPLLAVHTPLSEQSRSDLHGPSQRGAAPAAGGPVAASAGTSASASSRGTAAAAAAAAGSSTCTAATSSTDMVELHVSSAAPRARNEARSLVTWRAEVERWVRLRLIDARCGKPHGANVTYTTTRAGVAACSGCGAVRWGGYCEFFFFCTGRV